MLSVRLTADQLRHLREHLADEFGAAAADIAADIAKVYFNATGKMNGDAWLRELRPKEANRFKDHFEGMEKQARSLISAMEWCEPHGPMSELTSRAGYSLSWGPLRQWLDMLADTAGAEAATHKTGRRGRPREVWRDELIRDVRDAYPPGAAAKTRGGNFERTIEMLLEWIGARTEDVHDVILRALGGKNRAGRARFNAPT